MSEVVVNSAEYIASLRDMRARLGRLELLHSRLDGTGIDYFDEDMGPGFGSADTLHSIGERVAEDVEAGDGLYGDMRGAVYLTPDAMDTLRRGHDLRLAVAPWGDGDGRDEEARLKELTAIVSEKLTLMGMGHSVDRDGVIIIPRDNLVRGAHQGAAPNLPQRLAGGGCVTSRRSRSAAPPAARSGHQPARTAARAARSS
jgi:hypothetical protein